MGVITLLVVCVLGEKAKGKLTNTVTQVLKACGSHVFG